MWDKLKMYKILNTILLVINANLNKRTLISSSVNPLPARSFLWYRTVGHLTIGRKGPAAGLGAMARAFLILVCLLLYFRAGWLNQVFTNRCQSLWKCPLGIILFPLGAIMVLKRKQSYYCIGYGTDRARHQSHRILWSSNTNKLHKMYSCNT